MARTASAAGIFFTAFRAMAIIVAALASITVMSDQLNPKLPDLFSALASAPDQNASYAIEQQIWSIWMQAPDPQASDLLERAQSAAESGSIPQALRLFDELTDRFPKFAEGWNQRAIMHFLIGDIDKSLADIARTLELEPRHFGALAGSGQCYFHLEMYREALASFEAALQVNPWMPAARQQVEILRTYLKDEMTPI